MANKKKMDEGTAEMAEMAGIIRSGAAEFLKTEFKTITHTGFQKRSIQIFY